MPSGPSEAQRVYYEVLGEIVSPEVAALYLESYFHVDVRSILEKVEVPTLVIHQEKDRSVPSAAGRNVASMIPDSRFLSLEGDSPLSNAEEVDALVDKIAVFLGDSPAEVEATSTPPGGTPSGGFATILFTDMASSTTLADRLGDAAAQEVRRTHNDIVRSALSANSGKEIKHTGDGIMASFTTASSALDSAIAIQRGVAAHKDAQPDSPLGVYVGINAGEPIAEDDDLFGTSINLAARICDHANAGQIVAADVVRQLTAGKDFLFSDLGETELRGFEDPVKLWELRWQED
jgi:class 3 adenylate cyclase